MLEGLRLYWKGTLALVISFEFYDFLKNILFTEHFGWLLLKIINSSSYLRVLAIVATKWFHQFFYNSSNDFAVCKHCGETLLPSENVTSSHELIFQKGATLCNRSTWKHAVFLCYAANLVASLVFCETEIYFI